MKKSKVLSGLLIAGGLLISLVTTNQQQVQAKDYSYKVVTVKKDPYAQLYDNNMQSIPRVIMNKSDWRVGKTKQVNGTYYYQVAGDEWVAANDVKANFDPATGKLNQKLIGTINSTITSIYDNQGNNTYDDGVNLAYQSQWTVGKVVRNSQGRLFYQVAPNMYVRDDDMTLNVTPNNIKDVPNFGLNGKPATTVTAPSSSSSSNSSNKPTGYSYNVARVIRSNGAKIYDHNGVSTSSSVPANSDWRVLRTFEMNGGLFFEIGDNEWLNANDCSTNFTPVASNTGSSSTNGGAAANTGSSSNSSNSNSSSNTGSSSSSSNGSSHHSTSPADDMTTNIAPHESAAAYQQAVVDSFNAKRAAQGLPALTINSKLTQAATIRTTEQYNDPTENENTTTGSRPDGSGIFSVFSEVGYNWSYARELNFLLSDSYSDLTQLNTPDKVAKALTLLYETAPGYSDDYMSPQAKEIGVSIRYSDKPGLHDKIYTVIEIGAPRSDE